MFLLVVKQMTREKCISERLCDISEDRGFHITARHSLFIITNVNCQDRQIQSEQQKKIVMNNEACDMNVALLVRLS